jgi:ATP-dependent Clp protease ATP-binding subunit ClpA
MFTAELSYTLEAAYREATTRKHAFFCLEHLLFALTYEPSCATLLEGCGADLLKLRSDLEGFFDKHIEQSEPESLEEEGPIQTAAIQRVLKAAVMHMHSASKAAVSCADVLVQMFQERDSHAVYFLTRQELTRLKVVEFISHGRPPMRLSDAHDLFVDGGEEQSTSARGKSGKRLLEEYAEDLSAQAEAGELDPVVGREREVSRVIQILLRRQKNNPLLLGEPGVGKTSITNALAQRISERAVPEYLTDARVYSIQMASLVAGTRYRGEFEERMRQLVAELTALKKAIVVIDELHTIVGAGSTGSGSMDAANLLKPVLSAGQIRVIGSSTYDEYKKTIEKDRALSRRFSPVTVDEPTIEESIAILEGLKAKYEEHHGVTYTQQALRAAVELSAKHINDRFLPDKAIDIMDEAGAANGMQGDSGLKEITEKEIEAVVSLVAKVPVQAVNANERESLKALEFELGSRVFGQERAVGTVAKAVKRSRANLTSPRKPVGSYLFAGPTGVGKTELARALSQVLGVPFHRFDMSEYMEKHAVARLIGAPPGYVGYEDGGILTDLVRKQPHAVLLFDEIEKAHEDIYNIMLQILDDASLTDSQGRKTDFRNVIIILTTNAGSERSRGLGFGNASSRGGEEQAIKKLFRPELRNRIDEIVYFEPLPEAVIERVVDKFVREIEIQLAERRIFIELGVGVREWLAKRGYDELLGARPMARIIQKEIKDPLSDEILFGQLQSGGKALVTLTDDKLSFSYQAEVLNNAAERGLQSA